MGSLLDKMVSSIAQVFWTVNVLSQAIAAGFAFSYVVVFGSFLQWTIRRRNWEFFTEQYAPFRRKLKVRRTYFAFLPVGPLLVAVLSLIANHGRHALLPQVLAVVFFLLYLGLAHIPTGFAKLEEQVNSGHPIDDERQIATYLRWNLPLHILLGSLYAAVAAALLLT
ncbi:MAG: hypothetical protein ACFNPY_00845 [Peptidiphaga sp.]